MQGCDGSNLDVLTCKCQIVRDVSSENFKRDAILIGAATVFSRYGYRRTSMTDLATETGVSSPAAYSYFKNKDEISRCVSEQLHVNVFDESKRMLEADPEKDPLQERRIRTNAWRR
ncbi:TetR/AcrR family transcriptional regulator [Myxococcota bacterium]|nr:TetR/AcrR family transcriptional regulator [Myxococcota bacterium]